MEMTWWLHNFHRCFLTLNDSIYNVNTITNRHANNPGLISKHSKEHIFTQKPLSLSHTDTHQATGETTAATRPHSQKISKKSNRTKPHSALSVKNKQQGHSGQNILKGGLTFTVEAIRSVWPLNLHWRTASFHSVVVLGPVSLKVQLLHNTRNGSFLKRYSHTTHHSICRPCGLACSCRQLT